MQPSSFKYEKPLHAFELVFDKKSVLVEVEENDVDALPLPTKLTLTSFTDIKQQILQATTDLNKKEFRDQTIMDNEGNKLLQQLHEYPIILARRIGGSRYNVCSNCGQDIRYPIIMQIHCMNCGQHRMLIPRCRFNVNLEDNSGTTGMIMNKAAEKLLSLTAEQIYERTSTKNNFPPMKDLHTGFINKIFSIRAKKAFARATNTTLQNYISSRAWKRNTTHIPLQH
ncbi:hypothetical protein RDI58_003866 [Solanum bulbocastanum]|uniref:Uncharacterized protein n=1 Tax=Solanum bulbocastanum TaxID=147425 RepID=A0AAN8YKR7_SOLBU